MNETKQEKYENYKVLKVKLKKALAAEFFYEAIFIEYAILEDRTESALIHAGVKHLNSKGNPAKLTDKINKMRSNPAFTQSYVRKRISFELLDDIIEWKRKRDTLIHALAKQSYDAGNLRDMANEGNELVKKLDNKARSTNRYFDKQMKDT
jgi:hypothetical protein